MSLRKHKMKQRSRRMPPPDQVRMGTIIHESSTEDDDSTDIDKCTSCGRWVDPEELYTWYDKSNVEEVPGVCYKCQQEQDEKFDSWYEKMYEDSWDD